MSMILSPVTDEKKEVIVLFIVVNVIARMYYGNWPNSFSYYLSILDFCHLDFTCFSV